MSGERRKVFPDQGKREGWNFLSCLHRNKPGTFGGRAGRHGGGGGVISPPMEEGRDLHQSTQGESLEGEGRDLISPPKGRAWALSVRPRGGGGWGIISPPKERAGALSVHPRRALGHYQLAKGGGGAGTSSVRPFGGRAGEPSVREWRGRGRHQSTHVSLTLITNPIWETVVDKHNAKGFSSFVSVLCYTYYRCISVKTIIRVKSTSDDALKCRFWEYNSKVSTQQNAVFASTKSAQHD